MSLSSADQSRLAQIIQRARELELSWPKGERHELRDLSADSRYRELKELVASCGGAESENLKRLAGAAAHFHDQVSLVHFYSFVVPFERLSHRALRDDEFLISEKDAKSRSNGLLPVKVVLENIRSAFNVGAIFRTAECLGASEIILCGYTPGPDDEKTSRTAMGTSEAVSWRRADRVSTVCGELRKEGYTIIALETAATATSLNDIKFDGKPVAFVLGNERFGVEGETLQASDAVCRIPVRGIKNSMNVGVAFGIAAFEWLRQSEFR